MKKKRKEKWINRIFNTTILTFMMISILVILLFFVVIVYRPMILSDKVDDGQLDTIDLAQEIIQPCFKTYYSCLNVIEEWNITDPWSIDYYVKECKNDLSQCKIDNIEEWVYLNIEYDYEKAENETLVHNLFLYNYSAEFTINTNKGICGDMAITTASLLKNAGFETYIVHQPEHWCIMVNDYEKARKLTYKGSFQTPFCHGDLELIDVYPV